MVEVDVLIKDIETDPTGRMVTLTVEAEIEGEPEEIRVTEMVGNLQEMTKEETRKHFSLIFEDVLRQKIGEKRELTPQKTWARAQDFIGERFTIKIAPLSTLRRPTIEDVQSARFLRDLSDPTKIWKLTVRSGVLEITESSLEEFLGRKERYQNWLL